MIRSPQRQLAPDAVGPGNDETTSMRGIADKARHDKEHRFGNLYGELNEPLLKEAWRGLNQSAASGIDRVMARDYEQELDANIEDLVERLKAKRYRAQAVRRHYIPKVDGKQRPLGIPVVEDKLLQAGVAMILEAIYEPDFLPASFGYRPGVGARDAVQALGFNLQYGLFGYVVEADIQGFFSHLDHDCLKRMLRERIADESFIGLIGQWLKAGVLEPDGSFLYPEAGTPEGGVVSPILANIYLHHGLDLWFEGVVKPYCRGKVLLIRYADDFVCAFQYQGDAEAFYRVLPKRLAKFGLEVAPEKTRLQQIPCRDAAPVCLSGVRVLLERGPPRRAAFDEAHGPQEAWPGAEGVQRLGADTPASAHQGVVPAGGVEAAGSFQLLWLVG
jgi:RNA-directed DNA polymerase